MAVPGKIDSDALALAILAGQRPEQLAKTFGASTRTIRRRVAAERAIHGDEWPVRRPRVPGAAKSSPKAAPKAAPKPAVVPAAPGPGASADELEDYATAVLVAETTAEDARSSDRSAAARALVEIAERRRARRPTDPLADVDPAEAAAAVLREIERATDNVEREIDHELGRSNPVDDVRGVH